MLSAILFLLCDIHVIYHMTKRELNSYYFELSNMMRGIFCKIGILKNKQNTYCEDVCPLKWTEVSIEFFDTDVRPIYFTVSTSF